MNDTAYTALRNRAACIDLTGRGNIRVTGEDRARLLHAMCTNHIEQLLPGMGCYAFFLTAQGRIVSDANLFALPGYLLLDTEPEAGDRLREHLEKFIIADDVTLENFGPCTAVINVEGPAAEDALKQLGAPAAHLPYAVTEWGHCLVTHVSYTGLPGYSLMVPLEEKPDLMARLGAGGVPEAKLTEMETVRLEQARPRYGVDFSETNIPQETQQLHAVHFSKGCYLGQEIVERVRSRGKVNRMLTALEIDGESAPVRGVKVHSEGKDVGEITSAEYSPALARVVAFAILRAEALSSLLTVEGASARVRRERS